MAITIKSNIVFGDKTYAPGQEKELEAEQGESLAYLSEQGAIEGYESKEEPQDESQEEGGAPARKAAAKKGGRK